MYSWLIRRPVFQVGQFQNCFCPRNIYPQKLVVFPRSLSVVNNKYFMSDTNGINKNPITRSSALSQHKNIELTAIPDQDFSSSNQNQQTPEVENISNKDKLKRAVKDYGATVIVFHVTISLMSLGISYLTISSGVDVASLLSKVGLDTQSSLTAGASTFVVAYAVHKVFAPVRISITLGATPFIVRYLRRVGILKPPKT